MARCFLFALLLGACSAAEPVSSEPAQPLPAPKVVSSTSTTSTTLDEQDPVFEAFRSSVTASELGGSWREGCPVAIEDLQQISVSYWGFDEQVKLGSLVAHVSVADDLVGVFEVLFEAGYPIERIDPIEVFAGDDDASMAANNTSAFNCRTVAGTNIWSQHAYGSAVDINPLQNPYVVGSSVYPPAGTTYLDRSLELPGMIVKGGVVVDAFESIGWIWGGTWDNNKDYQHFSVAGQ